MKRKITTLVATCSALALMPATASAQAASASDSAALRAEIDALKAQISAMEARLGSVSAKSEANSTAIAAAPAPDKSEFKVKWKGAPELETESGWSFKPRGRILIDAATVDAPDSIADNGLGFSNEIRRARLGVEGTIPGGFGYKFEADFADNGVELMDAILTYKAKGLTFTVGQHNNFQGLEELSSSNDTSFLERAAFTDAFGFQRRLGLSAQYQTGALLLQGGAFSSNVDDLGDDANNAYGFDGRVVFAPKLGDAQLHFGGSAHWRDLGDTFDSVRYRQRPLVHSTDTRFIDTGSLIGATSETGYGLEAAAIVGRFHAAAESFWQNVERTGAADPTFFGASVEAGVFLTNDHREYKGGVFKGVKVRNPVGEGGLGAWQVNVRYDRLDLNDAGIVGGTQDGYMASLIWTPVDYVRFLLNYGHLVYDNAAIPAAGGDRSYSADVVGARAQISF